MGQHDNDQARTHAEKHATGPAQRDTTKPKATSAAQADKLAGSVVGAGAQRLTQLQSKLDFGEQVIGSDTSEQVHAPWNLSDMPAVARFEVAGDGFQLTSTNTLTLPSSGAMSGQEAGSAETNSPNIQFSPTRLGEYRGTLTVTVGWNLDGHVETQVVQLSGRARALDQAPTAEKNDADAGATSAAAPTPSPAPKISRSVDAAYSAQVEHAANKAADAAKSLGDEQAAGVGLVEKEASAYQKRLAKASPSIWWDLAEIALSIGTAGVAAHVAKNLLPRLLGETIEEDVPIAGGATMTKQVPAKLAEFTTDAVKQAIKTASSTAMKDLKPSGGGQTQGDGLPGSDFGHSSNQRIDFFAEQEALLRHQGRLTSDNLADLGLQLQPLVPKHPEQVVKVLDGLRQQFDDSANAAEQLQANAVAPQWATFIARTTLGTEDAKTPAGKTRQVTDTKPLRPTKLEGTPKLVNGLLDIYVANTMSYPKVLGAKLHGVSQEIADRIGGEPLENVPMPVRFVIGPNDARPTIVTKDEAGRIRVEGGPDQGQDEAKRIKPAEQMVDRILSVALRAWGIEIESDDATGRR